MADEERAAVARIGSRDPGADPDDPYEDVDVSELPEWWRRAIKEFEAHDLRPYRPPRFEDGVLTHTVVEELEREFDIRITFGSVESDFRERWEVRIDGTQIDEIGRRRSPNGYSVYETGSEAFEELVRDAVEPAEA